MKKEEYILNIYERDKNFFDGTKVNENLLTLVPIGENGLRSYPARRKNVSTGEDYPLVNPRKVKEGNILFAKVHEKIGNFKPEQFWAINVVHKYSGVLFYEWLDGPKKGQVEYTDLKSYFFIKEILPYTFIVPKGYYLNDIHNTKQNYTYINF